MATKTKMFTAATKDCFLFDPEKLVLVTDKESPYYDPRVEGKPPTELVESILVQGVIKPIVVTKDPEGNAIVVDGRQRVKAALLANEKLKADGAKTVRVPAVYRSGSQKALAGVSISANEIRRDDDILIKAHKAESLLNMGYIENEIAGLFGVSISTIKNWLCVCALAPEVQAEIKAGNFAPSHAPKLAKLEPADQISAMKKLQKEKAVKKPRGKKGAKEKAEKAARIRSRKACEEMIEVLGPDHVFVQVLNWALGSDIDLSLFTCEECTSDGRDGFFVSDN